jgi:hypothetical protein
MLLHIRSLTGKEHFTSKFIRVGNEVYIIGPDDDLTYHKELAEKHKILERIEHFKNQDPEMVDGGMMFVSGPVIRIGAASTSLSIPTVDRARKQTILKLRREYPAFSIKEVSDE